MTGAVRRHHAGAATSLSELYTGDASIKLAVSDIFGGNAFLPVLFLLATLISDTAALPQAQDTRRPGRPPDRRLSLQP